MASYWAAMWTISVLLNREQVSHYKTLTEDKRDRDLFCVLITVYGQLFEEPLLRLSQDYPREEKKTSHFVILVFWTAVFEPFKIGLTSASS